MTQQAVPQPVDELNRHAARGGHPIAARLEHASVVTNWSDGTEERFPVVWLRHACSCARCGQSTKGVRPRFKAHLDPAPPESVEVCESRLIIDWGDHHRSTFEADWLAGHRLSTSARDSRRPNPVIWCADAPAPTPFPYEQICAERAVHLELLRRIRDHGFALLSEVPTAYERIDEIAGLFGERRITNYGVYELKAKPNPEISGDMSVGLDPHTDEMYRIEPPAITLFQVVEPAVTGGDSTLVDGFRLAQRLAAEDPAAFEALTTIPARFHRELDDGHIFDLRALIIVRDHDGEVSGLRFNDRCLAPVDAAPRDVERLYRAIGVLFEMIVSGDDMIQCRLGAGDMLVFNNHRLLHGRTAFDPGSGRHVRSVHVDLDDYHSTLRAALRRVGDPAEWMQLGAMAHV